MLLIYWTDHVGAIYAIILILFFFCLFYGQPGKNSKSDCIEKQ